MWSAMRECVWSEPSYFVSGRNLNFSIIGITVLQAGETAYYNSICKCSGHTIVKHYIWIILFDVLEEGEWGKVVWRYVMTKPIYNLQCPSAILSFSKMIYFIIIIIREIRGGFRWGRGGRAPLFFLQSLVFCNNFEELQTVLLKLNWSSIMHL